MTYFELIVFLRELVNKPRSESLIETLNKKDVFLKGDRYYRFVEQLGNTIESRISKAFYNIKEKALIDDSINFDKFVIEFNEFKEEINFAFKIANIKLLEENNKNALNKSIKKSILNMANELINYFEGDKEIVSGLENFIKEENL